ncbi:SDR family NAD(P)-dependent oxidoreductase, partial [Clostridium sp. SL.3.18]|nr:SDR family NAD(P)-dependent oxidoreductase [Clostridium sp. SL.3.18]
SRYGKIINTCSIQGIRCTMGMPGTPYNSSKGGDIMMVSSLAAEWAQYGITVNGIGPGYFPTDIDKEYLATDYFKVVL